MNALKIILIVKVVFTAVCWSLPLLFFPERAAELLRISVPQPILFAHLLGAAFLALLVGYVLGLRDLYRNKEAGNVVRVGIVSNGSAFLLLLMFAGQWSKWGTRAAAFLGFSTAATLLITLGLAKFGLTPRDSTRK